MIPHTLAEVASMTAAGESFDYCLANFLDAFYAAPAAAAIEAPALRAVLLHESPPAFRCRNLFVSANALARA